MALGVNRAQVKTESRADWCILLLGAAERYWMGAVRHWWSTVSLLAGILVAEVGLAGFLLPNHFIDGGVTGASMLLAQLSGLPLPVLLVAVNVPFVLMGYRHIGRTFAVKSSLAIIGLALCLALIPSPVATG
jgi:uncharacterized membrane-anchored protein YitT (DUF2179 family)